jgi:hypothetical protein
MKVSQQWVGPGWRRWSWGGPRPWCPYSNPHPGKIQTLCTVEPVVQHGLWEARYTSVEHAMREVAAITYLMGRGYDHATAHQIVESWEVDERF